MKVYLAGPMRGYPEFNFPAFTDAAAKLREADWEVCSPHEHDLNNGFNPAGMKGDMGELGPSGFNLQEALVWDLTYVIKEADAVVVLPGWEKSEGAQAEAHAAKAVGKPVLTLDEALLGEPDAADIIDTDALPPDSPRAASLKRALGYVTGDRNASYGPPTQDFRRSANMWTAFGFRFVQHDDACTCGGARPIMAHHIANALILLKQSRLAWQPGKADSWDDTSGYAACGHECAVEEAKEDEAKVEKTRRMLSYIAGRWGPQSTSNQPVG